MMRLADGFEERPGCLVKQVFQLQLQVAVASEGQGAQLGDARSAAVLTPDGGIDQRLGPEAVHGVDQQPRPAIAEMQAPGGLRKRAAGGDLLQQIRARLGHGGNTADLHPHFTAEPGRMLFPGFGLHSVSVQMMTSVALIMVMAGTFFLRFSRLTDALLLNETVSYTHLTLPTIYSV